MYFVLGCIDRKLDQITDLEMVKFGREGDTSFWVQSSLGKTKLKSLLWLICILVVLVVQCPLYISPQGGSPSFETAAQAEIQ